MSDQKIFPKKYTTKLNDFAEGFMEAAQSASTEEVKKMILIAEQHIYDADYAVENNAEILKQKEQLKNDMEPFKETKQVATAKIKFALYTLENRGVKI